MIVETLRLGPLEMVVMISFLGSLGATCTQMSLTFQWSHDLLFDRVKQSGWESPTD